MSMRVDGVDVDVDVDVYLAHSPSIPHGDDSRHVVRDATQLHTSI